MQLRPRLRPTHVRAPGDSGPNSGWRQGGGGGGGGVSVVTAAAAVVVAAAATAVGLTAAEVEPSSWYRDPRWPPPPPVLHPALQDGRI